MKKSKKFKRLFLISAVILPTYLIFSRFNMIEELLPNSNASSQVNLEDENTKTLDQITEEIEVDQEVTIKYGQAYLDDTVFIDENSLKVIKYPDDIFALVNKERNLPSDFVPQNLVIPDVPFPFKEDLEKKYMKEEAARALEKLFAEAKKDNIDLYATSGYRSYNTQKGIFNYKASRLGEEEANKTSAYPGQSEHQTGLAMDVTCPEVGFKLEEEFGQTNEGIWLKENAHKFGFIIRYLKGKEDITGYVYEPWHIRYVGEEIANIVTEEEITLEEYFLTY